MIRLDILEGIAFALSNRLKSIGLSWIKNNNFETISFFLNGLFEDKIYKISAFDPLRFLIENKLQSNFEYVKNYPTFLTDLTNSRTATCGIIKCKKTLIFWQSSYSSHCNDKSKELMGRAAMIRFSSDSLGSKLEVREDISKLFLVIDGNWKEKHINSLSACGFDGIFYPDELSQLVNSIV